MWSLHYYIILQIVPAYILILHCDYFWHQQWPYLFVSMPRYTTRQFTSLFHDKENSNTHNMILFDFFHFLLHIDNFSIELNRKWKAVMQYRHVKTCPSDGPELWGRPVALTRPCWTRVLLRNTLAEIVRCHAGFNLLFVSLRRRTLVYDDDGTHCDWTTWLAQRNVMAEYSAQLGHRGSATTNVWLFLQTEHVNFALNFTISCKYIFSFHHHHHHHHFAVNKDHRS